jgi:hypothetical protein
MQTAHDAAEIPLLTGQVFDRLEGTGDTGAEKNEQPDAADQDNPAKENRQGTQVIER